MPGRGHISCDIDDARRERGNDEAQPVTHLVSLLLHGLGRIGIAVLGQTEQLAERNLAKLGLQFPEVTQGGPARSKPLPTAAPAAGTLRPIRIHRYMTE